MARREAASASPSGGLEPRLRAAASPLRRGGARRGPREEAAHRRRDEHQLGPGPARGACREVLVQRGRGEQRLCFRAGGLDGRGQCRLARRAPVARGSDRAPPPCSPPGVGGGRTWRPRAERDAAAYHRGAAQPRAAGWRHRVLRGGGCGGHARHAPTTLARRGHGLHRRPRRGGEGSGRRRETPLAAPSVCRVGERQPFAGRSRGLVPARAPAGQSERPGRGAGVRPRQWSDGPRRARFGGCPALDKP
mmetsp:Transcript_31548/g.99188  ORF Transcript_31548/g.99188 Transcript_31548/m.99188 type:complete len:249 (+) Transcript_31548:329-1075(+)